MQVMYTGAVPQLMAFKGFQGEVKHGDVLEMDEQTLSELSFLSFEIMDNKKKKKKKIQEVK